MSSQTQADSYPPATSPNPYVAPSPANYPTKNGNHSPPHSPSQTKSKGDGFWRGW
ncbi:uncharacterized protein LOC105650609 [Jatropha curcas]|uniref:uncharacterized protein LOC105650609 n=1 Tax=Jatropha curcas TaxID=180498 RepID=UPI0005FB926F|nr:uncharacterized protein LOC105650609 [Jatropha curcas]